MSMYRSSGLYGFGCRILCNELDLMLMEPIALQSSAARQKLKFEPGFSGRMAVDSENSSPPTMVHANY